MASPTTTPPSCLKSNPIAGDDIDKIIRIKTAFHDMTLSDIRREVCGNYAVPLNISSNIPIPSHIPSSVSNIKPDDNISPPSEPKHVLWFRYKKDTVNRDSFPENNTAITALNSFIDTRYDLRVISLRHYKHSASIMLNRKPHLRFEYVAVSSALSKIAGTTKHIPIYVRRPKKDRPSNNPELAAAKAKAKELRFAKRWAKNEFPPHKTFKHRYQQIPLPDPKDPSKFTSDDPSDFSREQAIQYLKMFHENDLPETDAMCILLCAHHGLPIPKAIAREGISFTKPFAEED